jgi:hypothetical protein
VRHQGRRDEIAALKSPCRRAPRNTTSSQQSSATCTWLSMSRTARSLINGPIALPGASPGPTMRSNAWRAAAMARQASSRMLSA